MRNGLAIKRDPTPAPGVDFRDTYEAHFSHVWHTLRRLGVADRDLEDAAHNVFVVVHRRLADYDPSRPIRPWLSGIAYRVAADERRRACNRRESTHRPRLVEERADSRPSPEQQASSRQRQRLVHEALDTLDDDRRVIFVMHELDGTSCPDIAQTLGVPLNTVYSRLRVARGRFAASVRRLRLTKGAFT